MKSTGVIRRIDDLGRIVIPKEIRKNLKIREGDTVEIFIEGSSILLRKFSLMTDLVSTANKLVSISSDLISKKILITNNEKVIACNSNLEKTYLNKELSSFILSKIEERMDYNQTSKAVVQFIPNVIEECYLFISPIIVDSDTIGVIVIFDSNEILESDKLIAKMLSSFLMKSVEG